MEKQPNHEHEDESGDSLKKRKISEEMSHQRYYVAKSRAREKWFKEFPNDKESDVQIDSPTYINFFKQSLEELESEDKNSN